MTYFQYIILSGKKMSGQNIFIQSQKWNQYSHPQPMLQSLSQNANPTEIKLYFTNQNTSWSLVKQIANTQLHKAQNYIKSNKLKAIYKQKVRGKGGKGRERRGEVIKADVDGKLSSATHIEEEDQSVSQFLSIWPSELIA